MQAVEALNNSSNGMGEGLEFFELDMDNSIRSLLMEMGTSQRLDDQDDDNIDIDDEQQEGHFHPLLLRSMDCETACKQQQQQQPCSDPSMHLTAEERTWALQLRHVLQQQDDDEPLPLLTDFEVAQYAIVTHGNIGEALRRIHGMHVFCQEYGIQESVDQAMIYFTEWFRHHPGHLLHMDTDPETCEPIVVLDLAAYFPGIATGHKPSNVAPTKSLTKTTTLVDVQWHIDVIKNYYQLHVSCSNFSSIRQGVFMIIDCDDIGWDNWSMEYSNRFHGELWAHYPIKFKSTLCYNTGSVANVCWNMIKPLMDSTMRESLQLGCQIVPEMEGTPAPEKLCELYLQPSLEMAQANLLQRIKELLTLRQINIQRFKLE
ncbi:expressed unknown protein [Seminavis robusta]|uniref:CRAL-TRIO domain-containing protein n=1 Tax=Seminavis robusta TaxID=568900 RepID=A0A9N8H7C8_9STRA|nr:expressed unknown protein [Seminavis robusta]|eukprot:Sro137_g064440.1 n/a (373) ;mRNA; f:73621-74739